MVRTWLFSEWDVKPLEGIEWRNARAAVLRLDFGWAKGGEKIMVVCTGKWSYSGYILKVKQN
jgi:hypothetical protein